MLRGQRLDAVEREQGLDVHRLLGPERAIVVERRDALARRDVVGTRFVGGLPDEFDDGLLRRAVIPRPQVIIAGVRCAKGKNRSDEHEG